MATRLITAQEFRSSRYADVAEQVDDIEKIIEQAEAHVERKLDRRLSKTQYTEIHRPASARIYLRQRPVISLDEIAVRGGHHEPWSSLSVDGFEVEPDDATGVLLDLHDGEAIVGREVKVVYTAGFDPIPADIKAAVINQTVLLAFQDLEVFGAGDAREPALKHLYAQIDDVLAPYKKVRLR
jgi:hypothetical protein